MNSRNISGYLLDDQMDWQVILSTLPTVTLDDIRNAAVDAG